VTFGVDDAIAAGLNVISKFIPDKDQQAKAEAELRIALLAADTQLAIAQAEINKIEAANEHIFVSGARPFILWVCGFSLAYHFILQPLLAFLFSCAGHQINLPIFDMDSLNTLLMGMLGLGGMRSFEKMKR